MSIFIGSAETLWVNINQQHLRGKKRSASGVFSLFIYSPMAPSLPVLAGNAMFYYSLGMREVLNMDREEFCDLVLQLKLWFLPVYKQQVVFHRWSNWLVINVLSMDPKWAIWGCVLPLLVVFLFFTLRLKMYWCFFQPPRFSHLVISNINKKHYESSSSYLHCMCTDNII